MRVRSALSYFIFLFLTKKCNKVHFLKPPATSCPLTLLTRLGYSLRKAR